MPIIALLLLRVERELVLPQGQLPALLRGQPPVVLFLRPVGVFLALEYYRLGNFPARQQYYHIVDTGIS
jgi:hypothetical protein